MKKSLKVSKNQMIKKPKMNGKQQKLKTRSLDCPSQELAASYFEPGSYDSEYIMRFTGVIISVASSFGSTQTLEVTGSKDSEMIVALFQTKYSFEVNTPVTVYGWLGLTPESHISLMVQLLEFNLPNEHEPNFIDPK